MGSPVGVVGFVGLIDLSLELAASLVRSGYDVQAFDAQMGRPSMVEFSERLGGTRCASAVEAVKGVGAVVLLISHIKQVDDLIFGPEGVREGLNKNTVVVLHTVILPADVQKLEKRLTEECDINVVVDAYVSRGMSEELSGKVVIASSGRSDAISRARPVLSAMCGKLYVFDGEIGAGSKAKMVTELLQAIHLVASIEAISLGVQARIHPWILYDIISNAAGNSWVFKHHVQQWLRAEHMKHHTLYVLVEKLATVLGFAKSLPFPLPLLGVAHQQLLGCAHNGADDDKAPLFKVWERVLGIKVEDAANEETYYPEELARQLTSRSKMVNRVGFIGLGAMGFGMATHLLRSNFVVIGYDVMTLFLLLYLLCIDDNMLENTVGTENFVSCCSFLDIFAFAFLPKQTVVS